VRDRFLAGRVEPVGGPPEKFGELIRSETAKLAPVVKKAGVRVD